MALTHYAGGAGNGATSFQAHTQGAPIVPRTISSAIGRVDGVGERLKGLLDQVSKIHDAIGGPRNIAEETSSNKQSPVGGGGAVWRLNDSAEAAHQVISEIEDHLTRIQVALG